MGYIFGKKLEISWKSYCNEGKFSGVICSRLDTKQKHHSCLRLIYNWASVLYKDGGSAYRKHRGCILCQCFVYVVVVTKMIMKGKYLLAYCGRCKLTKAKTIHSKSGWKMSGLTSGACDSLACFYQIISPNQRVCFDNSFRSFTQGRNCFQSISYFPIKRVAWKRRGRRKVGKGKNCFCTADRGNKIPRCTLFYYKKGNVARIFRKVFSFFITKVPSPKYVPICTLVNTKPIFPKFLSINHTHKFTHWQHTTPDISFFKNFTISR